MRYITIAEMTKTIRDNFYRIPHDVDFVIGILRSGMLPATIISEFLNRPLTDVNSFCAGVEPSGGQRLSYNDFYGTKNTITKNKVLVVDDTLANGNSIDECKEKLKPFEGDYEFIYLTIYFEGPSDVGKVDLYLEDTRIGWAKEKDLVIFEWNVFHQILALSSSSMWDMDGVLCKNPPDDFYKDEYEKYIKDAEPLFIPSLQIGEIVTYRINEYRDVTTVWLDKHGVKYKNLIMFNAKTREERNDSGMPSHVMKGVYYKNSSWAKLFVESDDGQAHAINQISGKPVYCVESNRLYI